MSACIKDIKRLAEGWLARHPKLKEYLWFVALWLGGLLSVFLLSMLLKLLIKGLWT